jgi:hypothetical protein
MHFNLVHNHGLRFDQLPRAVYNSLDTAVSSVAFAILGMAVCGQMLFPNYPVISSVLPETITYDFCKPAWLFGCSGCSCRDASLGKGKNAPLPGGHAGDKIGHKSMVANQVNLDA